MMKANQILTEKIIEIVKLNGMIYRYHFGYRREREFRRAISELRKTGMILIPDGNKMYHPIEHYTDEWIDRYSRSQLRSLKTQYFNTLKPITDLIKDEKRRKLFGDLFALMEELE